MDKDIAWAMYFAGVAALRFHPRNYNPDQHLIPPEGQGNALRRELALAATIADQMLEYHNRRFPWHGSEPSSAAQSAQ